MLFDYLKNKSILITGGTGSFGQACVKMLMERTEASRIVIFSRDELKQSAMESSIHDPQKRLRFFLGDVRDLPRLQRAFYKMDYVIHAAALKQVPTLEYNPFEAVKTNIIGTQNVIDAAIDQNIKNVLLISTDKAANPANLYGATKLCSEKLIISGNSYAGGERTKFAVVRYGNVFGSRGSLVQIIKEKRKTRVLDLTHGDMTRFWIILEDGLNFVLDKLNRMHGGEIFIPKMPSMKTIDIIKALAPECELRVTGIRSGEKLHETLVTSEEARHTKEYGDYYVILPEGIIWGHQDKYEDGKVLDENFSFESQNNTRWLDELGLKRFIDSINY